MNHIETMNAGNCVLSVRPRWAGPVQLAPVAVADTGRTLSIATRTARALADVPFTGDVSGIAYKTSDVARPWLGRPPV